MATNEASASRMETMLYHQILAQSLVAVRARRHRLKSITTSYVVRIRPDRSKIRTAPDDPASVADLIPGIALRAAQLAADAGYAVDRQVLIGGGGVARPGDGAAAVG